MLALAVAAGAVAAPARADYGPGAEAASANGALLGDNDSTVPSVSDDGRYVVFRTAAVNLMGSPERPDEAYKAAIVRRDMVTGAVELVAPPQRVRRSDGAELNAGPTGAGSISGNGRYVLFDTTVALAQDTDLNTNSDVYVRDMSRPLTDAGAYELVSALDGADEAPAYLDDPARGSRGGREGFAISDDGRRAVFRTEVRSNLPAGGSTQAPRAQVFVRLLDTDETLLVTRDKSDRTMPGTPVAPAGAATPRPNPVLSGDGTVVAWVDTNAAAQTFTLPGEPAVPAILWRDLTAGPGAPTRRVAGTSDPDDPGCPPGAAYPSGGNTATGPCFGPFAVSEALSGNDVIDVGDLSIGDDGRRVLFVSISQQRPFDQRTAGNIAYLADMSPGLTRKQGVRRVVRGLGSGRVLEATLAGGGTRLAFTSAGRVFEGPRSLGAFPAQETTTNAFVVDLEQGIVQRATVGADGTDFRGQIPDTESGAIMDPKPGGLALSDDAGAIAFTADDGNLFAGDANAALDVQVVRGTPGIAIPRSAFTAPVPVPVAPAGGELLRSLRPLLPVHPVIGYLTVDRRGVARLTVRVPAAGRVSATATAPVRGRRLRVARAGRRPKAAATVHLRLAPTLAARRAARRARRLRVRIDVRYTPREGRSTSAVRRYILRGGARP